MQTPGYQIRTATPDPGQPPWADDSPAAAHARWLHKQGYVRPAGKPRSAAANTRGMAQPRPRPAKPARVQTDTRWEWFLILRPGRCDACGERIGRDEPSAYCHAMGAHERRCLLCAANEAIQPKPSKQYTAATEVAPINTRPSKTPRTASSKRSRKRVYRTRRH